MRRRRDLGESPRSGIETIAVKAVGAQASEVIDTYVFNFGILGSNWGTAH